MNKMNKDQARCFIKEKLESYLQSKGINTRQNFNCLNPDHDDKNPSMSFDRKRNKVHCFSCSADFDTIDLIGIDHNLLSSAEMFKKAYELYDISLTKSDLGKSNNQEAQKSNQFKQGKQKIEWEEFNRYIKSCKDRVKQTGYFKKRGLSEKTIDLFNLGYDPNCTHGTGGKMWDAVIIPTGKGTHTVRNTSPNADKKDRIRKAGGSPMYNIAALYGGKPTFVVEGEIDALSIIEVGGQAVGLGSIENSNKFIDLCREKAPNNVLILCLDNDDRGKKATQRLKDQLTKHKISFLNANIAGDHKDPNDALMADREGLTQRIKQAVEKAKNLGEERSKDAINKKDIEEYAKKSVAYAVPKFLESIANASEMQYTPTKFNKLDSALEGGLFEGLYALGAIPSIGKTTFLLQMADQIAQQGRDVLMFSLEMSKTALMAKSISRLTLEMASNKKHAKTSKDIKIKKRYSNYGEQEKKIIGDAAEVYREFGVNMYIDASIKGDIISKIEGAIKEHLKVTGKRPVVIIDYLQLMAYLDISSGTDKQKTDRAVSQLRGLSESFKIPVIVVCSLNRQSYYDPVRMESFKESGSIEYSCDVILGMQLEGVGTKNFNVVDAKKKDPRRIELVILKDRDGSMGETIRFEYYPPYNFFKEV